MHVGAEARIAPLLTLRAGFAQVSNIGTGAGYTFGIGFKGLIRSGGDIASTTSWWEQTDDEINAQLGVKGTYLMLFDYAVQTLGDFSNAHRFSVSLKF